MNPQRCGQVWSETVAKVQIEAWAELVAVVAVSVTLVTVFIVFLR